MVMMETRGDDVLKRRFHATDDGREIEMETIPIVRKGKRKSCTFNGPRDRIS